MTITSTEDGLHLDGSILWLDGKRSGQLSFLSSAAAAHTANASSQVIATEETMKLLETRKKKPAGLICQYNRPFSIGKLRMELLPSGSILGGASLYVETEQGRLLYAPTLQPEKTTLVRQMQLKKAQTLVLGAFHPEPASAMPSRRKEKERMLNAVKAEWEAGRCPVIFCPPIATAQEITQLLAEEGLPVCVHSGIYHANRIYETYGANLGKYSLYATKRRQKKITILPLPKSAARGIRHTIPDGPVFIVEETLTPTNAPCAGAEVVDRFFISTHADGRDIREIINAVSPKEVLFFGPYAKRYCEDLKHCNADVKPLYEESAPPIF